MRRKIVQDVLQMLPQSTLEGDIIDLRGNIEGWKVLFNVKFSEYNYSIEAIAYDLPYLPNNLKGIHDGSLGFQTFCGKDWTFIHSEHGIRGEGEAIFIVDALIRYFSFLQFTFIDILDPIKFEECFEVNK